MGQDGSAQESWTEGSKTGEGKRLVGISRRKQSQMQMEQQSKQDLEEKDRKKHQEREKEIDILEIAELDDEGQDLRKQVAMAPKARLNKVQDLDELDGDELTIPAHIDESIDLGTLKKHLLQPSLVEEEQDHWTVQSLLMELREKDEKDKEEAA